MKTELKQREVWLDILKGLAIFFIIASHMPMGKKLITVLWSFHLPLFFLISGYTFRPKEEKEMIKSKFKRCMIPYYFTCLLLMIANNISDIYYHKWNMGGFFAIIKRWTWAGLYGSCWSYDHPFPIYDIGAIWFLCTLFVTLILFNYVMNREEKYQPFLVLLLLYIGLQLNQFLWLPFNFASSCVCVLFLYVGYLAKKYDILKNKSITLNLFLLLMSFLCIHYHSMTIIGNNTYTYGLFSLLGGISISYFIARFSKILEKTKRMSKFFAFYGRNSLIVLCFHLIEIDFIKWTRIIHFGNNYMDFTIIFALKLLWAYIFIKIVEKTKLRKIFGL